MENTTNELHDHFATFRNDLIASGMVTEAAESSSSPTGVNNSRRNVEWRGKDPSLTVDFGNVEGLDFAGGFSTAAGAL